MIALSINKVDLTSRLDQAREALAHEQFEEALALSREVVEVDPENAAALLIAGEACVRSGQFDAAAAYYMKVSPSEDGAYVSAQFAAAEVLRHTGRLSEAEACLRRVVEDAPDHGASHERLALLLESRGQRWKARSHWRSALAGDRFSAASLRLLADSEARFEPPAGGNATAPRSELLTAIIHQSQQDRTAAQQLLVQIIAAESDNVEAHFRLGQLLADETPELLADWNSRLPPSADDHPGIWRVRGLWSQFSQQPDSAMRCYWETLKRDPCDRTAAYQLARLVQHSGHENQGSRLARYADTLLQLSVEMHRLDLNPNETSALPGIVQLLEQIERHDEAIAWCRIAMSTASIDGDMHQILGRLESKRDTRPTVPVQALAALNLSRLPLPAWGKRSDPAPHPTSMVSTIRFENQAQEAGLSFQYHNGHLAGDEGMRMYSFTGGGIGVVDFDHDGWPDIACTQGGDWEIPDSLEFNDRLYRNIDGEVFNDVSSVAGMESAGFSQGVSCGDVNNDGWTDIYVARIGRNQLYINNGDGTFSDETHLITPSGTRWTTSCLIADLDGDSNADILDVNYLTGDDVFSRLCDYGGHQRACTPGTFSFERDDVWINDGTGGFHLADKLGAGFGDEPRPGLGAVAADFEHSGRLSVFVANDAVANWYYQFAHADGGGLRATDQATLNGLGVDRDGRAQACMGVACSDADGNGKPDIFVTNYYQEHNTLYLSEDFGFADASRERGLFTASLPMLGFGTQFLDADLDGNEDLIVANGHVDDYGFDRIPFRMPAQFFRNEGHRFADLSQESGDYFRRHTLGRSAATIDWNRDGRTDVAVMHLDEPLALLTNASEGAGQWLKFRLVATRTQRDAIGTRVAVTFKNGQTMERQLVAGSGYQASNEPVLMFGLGTEPEIKDIQVRWPSGDTMTIPSGVTPDSEIILVEGSDWCHGLQ